MKLLILTQTVDSHDPVLGFFHRWIGEFSHRFEQLTVVCLREGAHALPHNVAVHSLGKEKGRASRLRYVLRLYRLIWRERNNYDAVLVHMNQEYVLLAGPFWLLFGKPIYLWRNHYAGSWATNLAGRLCAQVFCTSKSSYTATFANTTLMPVGIDTGVFHPTPDASPLPHTILSLGRIAPSKHVETIIEAVALLAKKGVTCSLDIYGDALPEHANYLESLRARVHESGLQEVVAFHGGVANTDTPMVYAAHAVFVNASRSGMFDKTIFEALASGALVVAASDDWKALAGEEWWFALDDAAQLAQRLEYVLRLAPEIRHTTAEALRSRLVKPQSLEALGAALQRAMTVSPRLTKTALLARYLFAGVTATATNLALTFLLERFTSLHYLVVVSLAVLAAVVVSFTLQKYVTFSGAHHSQTRTQFGLFAAFALFNLCVNDVLVYLIFSVAGLHMLVVAEALAAVIVAGYSFFLYRHGIFKPKARV